MLVSLTVDEIMSAPVETVAEDATARQVAEHLSAEDVGALVVLDDGSPVGIVTEADLVDLLAGAADVDDLTVGEFMSRDLVTVAPDASVEHAAETLADGDFRRLPVVEDDELVGIVTTTDISYYLPRYRPRRGDRGEPGTPRYDVRPETAYERDDWSFECHSVREDEVSVGDVVRFSKLLTEANVRHFAEVSGDTNRLHLDESYAAETRFGGRIVHGTLVAGLVSAAIARLPGLTIYLSQEIGFCGPVRIRERVTAVCEVVENVGEDRYLLRTDVLDSEEETVVEGEAVVVIDELPESASVEVRELD
jgi:CBS domain-containing protein/acyl dehydratase